jgi:hypothetical protein
VTGQRTSYSDARCYMFHATHVSFTQIRLALHFYRCFQDCFFSAPSDGIPRAANPRHIICIESFCSITRDDCRNTAFKWVMNASFCIPSSSSFCHHTIQCYIYSVRQKALRQYKLRLTSVVVCCVVRPCSPWIPTFQIIIPADLDSMILRNVGTHLQAHMVSQSITPWWAFSLP